MALSLEDRLRYATEYVKTCLQINAPKDTWNLTYSITIKEVNAKHYVISVGNEIADYAIYTNETWQSSKWNGKQNPNEGWIQATIAQCETMIQTIMKGPLTAEQAQKAVNDVKTKFDNLYENEKGGNE